MAALAAAPASAEIGPNSIATSEGCDRKLALQISRAKTALGAAKYHAEQAALAPETVRADLELFADTKAQIAEMEKEAVQALMRACVAY